MNPNELIQYSELLLRLKAKIKTAQRNAIFAVNNELLIVYWEIGNAINEQERISGWGSKIVERLASDLRSEFTNMKGLSSRNLRYMKDFALAYPTFLQQPAAGQKSAENQSDTILQQAAAKLPWGHHQVLLVKLKSREERAFYITKAVENGWSRSVLEHQIESGLHGSQGALVNNFHATLPSQDSDLTVQVFKDPYNFDFIMLGEQAKERDLENALMTHVTKVLLELGAGFAFMGRQRKFEVGGRDFFVDLLFYHTKLRCHIIIELKIGEFEPEYVSKMNLYLGMADDQLKGVHDEASIGLILCKTNNRIVAEYALRDSTKPIGISEYRIAERLPDNLLGELPSIEEIEQRVDEHIQESQSPIESRLSVVRSKLQSLNKKEITAVVTNDLLQTLFTDGLKPLYMRITQRLFEVFNPYFVSQELSWSFGGTAVHHLDDLESLWRSQQNWEGRREVGFQYTMKGFKKAGPENFSVWLSLNLILDDYWFGFKSDRDFQKPFIKKMFDEPFTAEDVQIIEDELMTIALDRIEGIIEEIEKAALR